MLDRKLEAALGAFRTEFKQEISLLVQETSLLLEYERAALKKSEPDVLEAPR